MTRLSNRTEHSTAVTTQVVTTETARIWLSLHNPEANYLTVAPSSGEKRACWNSQFLGERWLGDGNRKMPIRSSSAGSFFWVLFLTDCSVMWGFMDGEHSDLQCGKKKQSRTSTRKLARLEYHTGTGKTDRNRQAPKRGKPPQQSYTRITKQRE